MSTQDAGSSDKPSTSNTISAALARSLTRGAAIYFSRPVRLFRPTKVSGWTTLRGAALRDGVSLSPQYMSSLIKKQGFLVIPRHFLPPLVLNAALGTVLWTSYSETSSALERHWPTHPVINAAVSGGVAGGLQSLAAAPAENVRLVLEGGEGAGPVKTLLGGKKAGKSTSGWSFAWKEVFVGSEPTVKTPATRAQVREVRDWMMEVKGMAGRGWEGWGWGCAKDVCGFSLFFAIFELSRTAAADLAQYSLVVSDKYRLSKTEKGKAHASRIVHSGTLVAGGVVAGLGYELVCRPFDSTRRLVYLRNVHARAVPSAPVPSILRVVMDKVQEEGIISFFRSHTVPGYNPEAKVSYSTAALRTLARVGPWGVGFLVWEGMGGGLGAM